MLANDVNITGAKVIWSRHGRCRQPELERHVFALRRPLAYRSFTYCGNGATKWCGLRNGDSGRGAHRRRKRGITCSTPSHSGSKCGHHFKHQTTGVLAFCKDAAGYPLTDRLVVGAGVTVDPNGGFTATVASHSGPATATFTFQPQELTGTPSTATYTATVNFPAPSGLVVNLIDGSTKQPLAMLRPTIAGLLRKIVLSSSIPSARPIRSPRSCPGAGGYT